MYRNQSVGNNCVRGFMFARKLKSFQMYEYYELHLGKKVMNKAFISISGEKEEKKKPHLPPLEVAPRTSQNLPLSSSES